MTEDEARVRLRDRGIRWRDWGAVPLWAVFSCFYLARSVPDAAGGAADLPWLAPVAAVIGLLNVWRSVRGARSLRRLVRDHQTLSQVEVVAPVQRRPVVRDAEGRRWEVDWGASLPVGKRLWSTPLGAGTAYALVGEAPDPVRLVAEGPRAVDR